ncbi:HNH endonuclease [Cryobacterium sp. 1639]|uniref:HNH endonuclease signature motif containing protein n=1 Tax=Cryobacterium inferilacus TaxID=2866629 RepID=UPI001C72C775|nr:HNH endonuclease signature motif containing protein [Cryobacterium sp. 1639]MBX0299494.1 HNH endonuclease [Cryobacterium sp. 1639]
MPSIAAVSAPDTPESAVLPADSALVHPLAAAVEAVEELGACSADYDALTDAELIAGQKKLATLRALIETRAVWLAKTLTHRSRRELGQQGLAARQGFLSPAELIQDLTGCTKADARKLMDVGTMLDDTEAAQAAATAAADEEEARRLLDEDAGLGGPADLDGLDGVGSVDSVDGNDGPGGVDGPGPACTAVSLPWYSPISAAVATGSLSVAAAHAIRAGLGAIDTVVTAEVLRTAVLDLLAEAKTMTVDALLKRSRRARDTLDAAGIATREQKAWDDRYLRVWTSDSGQVHLNGQFPPEQGAFLLSVYDSATGPRRGGVRFVDPERAAWAKAVQDDPRSTDQLTADTFIDLIKAGSTVNPDRMLGGRTPAVRVLTTTPAPARPTDAPAPARSADEPAPAPAPTPARPTDAPGPARPTDAPVPEPVPEPPPEIDPTAVLVAIPDGTGHGFIEGHTEPVSQETIDRLCCTGGTLQIDFDNDGQPLNLGREQRVFTAGQRIALAARDGGCIWGDCDKPPSRTEAHHLEEWVRDHGATDIALGVLLCPPHHRLLHSQGWQIFENQGVYWLRPPASVDPGQTLIRMRSKSAAAQEQQPRGDARN